ncbi:putative c2hc5 finger protein [Phaeoacremonium minimum UCRPA7]|uniref:Putative c2hc5 finger protein n=1 Tax=Phaeoacremonium minimum (strain UCR-PA7) TaxID=1286976 RepID=R8BX81_PHAM7|nr:putative c2hc5 finger protein [Phaeoacremonium minimum UCRPA7]EOO03889.1 putative c2hc5 finger protein [Phaeoacremonium minimum UCRPA7]
MSLIQLSRLIDLPDSDLQQVLDYALTLSKVEAADHFKNLLGDSPQAIEFIAAFNSRRQGPPGAAASSLSQTTNQQQIQELDAVPKAHRQTKKKKALLHTPAPRQVASLGPTPGTAYNKKALDDDYIIGRSGSTTPVNSRPPSKAPTPKSSTPPPSKPPPSAAGSLVSDLLAAPKSKPRSNPVSRTSTPGPGSRGNNNSTKVSIAGGTPMHGASTALDDLDAAIRSLEITTNPSLSGTDDVSARRCNCVATRHPLQTAAPNCLSCGKVICVKEGLGPCTFCGTPLLSQAEVQAMIKELRLERGRERMAADREAHKRPDVAGTPRPFTKGRGEADGEMSTAEAKAREHRDKLLGFQAQNARRTTVRDEAADFDVSGAMAGAFGGNIWSSPEDRARELKRQQKILRELEWNARPDYEKRKQVVSIDLVGGRVVKKMMAVDRPPSPDEEVTNSETHALEEVNPNRGGGNGGTFSRNPLLGGMIKPVYDGKGKGVELEGRKDRKTKWRRVQDDLDDNEAVILDGGIYGGKMDGSITTGGDEPPCG